MRFTSAAANKLIKRLNEDKEMYLQKEEDSKTYVASVDEEPSVPDFDFASNSAKIEEIDLKIVRLKHAVNLSNALARIDVDGQAMSVDEILVRMAQLSRRLETYREMRKTPPKARVNEYGAASASPQYRYINYDMDVLAAEYEKTAGLLERMQLALDKYNQTAEFEVDM